MSEPTPKAVIEKPHDTYIIHHADGQSGYVGCDTEGCGYQGPVFEGDHFEYLCEQNASEHRRARAGWPADSASTAASTRPQCHD